MEPCTSASCANSVPPRLSLRSTSTCVLRSICCARISPSTSCSVKFFEPTTICGGDAHELSSSALRPAIIFVRSIPIPHPPPTPSPPRAARPPARPVYRIIEIPRNCRRHAQSPRANEGRNRRRPDRRHRGNPQSAHNRRHRQWQFHLPQNLPLRHPHSLRRFANRRVHAQNSL